MNPFIFPLSDDIASLTDAFCTGVEKKSVDGAVVGLVTVFAKLLVSDEGSVEFPTDIGADPFEKRPPIFPSRLLNALPMLLKNPPPDDCGAGWRLGEGAVAGEAAGAPVPKKSLPDAGVVVADGGAKKSSFMAMMIVR